MSDSDFVDVGDELVVRIAGYPVGKAVVEGHTSNGDWIVYAYDNHNKRLGTFYLPPNFKDYDQVDGVAHEPVDYSDYSSGSTHPDCPGDTDLCPDNGCKNCQGQQYDNYIRGRIKR
jgi:hypothetical protein